MWKRPNGLHSSQFLTGPIHQAVGQKYYNLNNESLIEVESYKKKAQRLQELLYDLKNYNNPQYTGHIFDQIQYDLFLQAFQEVTNSDGIPLSNSFLGIKIANARKGALFEKELVDIQKALIIAIEKAMSKENIYLESQNLKNGSITINTGSGKTAINFPDITGPLNKAILHDICGVASYKTLKQGKKTTKHYVVEAVNPKIDIINQSALEVDASIKMFYPTLAQFAQLYLQSTITAKNYIAESVNKGISLGKTQIFRIMADFIPTLNVIQNRDQEISFQYAIFKRYGGLVKQKITADKQIPIHFAHIKNIYELMGIGQSITDPALKELQDYIKRGAEYLIVNVSDSANIFVKSTRDLLRQRYKKEGLIGLSAVGKEITLNGSYLT